MDEQLARFSREQLVAVVRAQQVTIRRLEDVVAATRAAHAAAMRVVALEEKRARLADLRESARVTAAELQARLGERDSRTVAAAAARRTPADRVAAHWRDGLTIEQSAAELGVDPRTVARRRKALGLAGAGRKVVRLRDPRRRS
jgi:hypothetical protein